MLIDRHCHLEGSLDPAWVRSESARRGLALPGSLEALWRGEAVAFDEDLSYAVETVGGGQEEGDAAEF